jgi:ABC-type lipoprotein export system ATPase subunit
MDIQPPIGSIWRKWDLQVQPIKSEWNSKLGTPEINEKLEQSVPEYIKTAIENDIEVIGVTDHNSGAAIDYALEQLEVAVIPGVELDTSEGWHLIIYFSNSYKESLGLSKWSEVIDDFLGSYCNITRPFFNSQNTAKKVQISTIELLKKIQHSNIGFAVFAHCFSNDGFFKKGDASSRIEVIKAYDEGLIDFSFEIKNELGQINEIKEKTFGWFQKEIKIPIISSSDAHSPSIVGNSFTWIKADPTLEGLKQIVYDPENRVKIQVNSPYHDYLKPYFSKITVKEKVSVFSSEDTVEFEKAEISLNRDLVSIIGGRGTGKSILINYVAWGFKKYDEEFLGTSNFSVDYNKTVEDRVEFDYINRNDLNFIYISQNELIKKSDKPKELYEEIKSTLGLEDLIFDENLSEKIYQINNQIFSIEQWLNKKDENEVKINDESYLKSEITRYQNLIETVTTQENRDKLSKYSTNLTSIKELEQRSTELISLLEEIVEFEKYINQKFTSISISIPKIDFFGQRWEINKLAKSIRTEIDIIINENNQIRTSFGDYKGDLSTLLEDVEKFQSNISNLNQRVKDIQARKNSLNSLYEEKKGIASLLKKEYEKQKKKVDDAWIQIISGKSDWSQEQKELIQKILNDRNIKIIGEIIFDKKAFYEQSKQFINGRAFKKKNEKNAIEELFQIRDFDSYIEFLEQKLEIFKVENDTYFYPDQHSSIDNLFYDKSTRANYLQVYPKIYYDKRTIDKLSAGQRGTIFLCLKLASSAFSQPIIYDQPEDDLDNQFIMNDLLSIFKELKKFRQIIIVTHNANLVVNADSEQVVIASNNNNILSYHSGSLENPKIISEVCDILEGGRLAFELRRNRYKTLTE